MELSLARIAEIIEGNVIGNPHKMIQGVASFDDADPGEITYAENVKFLKKIAETEAGAGIVPRDFKTSSKNMVQVDNPKLAFAKVLERFNPKQQPSPGISSNAYIGKQFTCGDKVSIAPFSVIGDNVTIGDHVVLRPHVVIGNNVVLGDDVMIYPHVTILDNCRLGNRVTIHAGTVIGSDGFGFVPDGKEYYKIPHTGIVQIDDDVEIGAGNTIDRATLGKTWICQGVKTDNLVHIAHNVTVGKNSIIVAQVGISGSVTIGENAILLGQAGVIGHLTIGDNVTVGAQSGVAKSIKDDEVVSGSPAISHRLNLKVYNMIPRLPELNKRLIKIEKKLKRIEDAKKDHGKNV